MCPWCNNVGIGFAEEVISHYFGIIFLEIGVKLGAPILQHESCRITNHFGLPILTEAIPKSLITTLIQYDIKMIKLDGPIP